MYEGAWRSVRPRLQYHAHWLSVLGLCALLAGCGAAMLERSDDGRTVRYAGESGITALATLRQLTDVETQATQYGEFVVAIGGVEAGPGEFWAFLVNDTMVKEGAGTWIANIGDVIEWRLRKVPGT